jgi:hypothetical protein
VSEETQDFRPPRALRGRRERLLWRSIAPVASANGTLSDGTKPLLMVLCVALAKAHADPDHVWDSDLKRLRALAKNFGLLK